MAVKSKRLIPVAPVERILRKAGENKIRISENASVELTDVLEEIGYNISVEAIKLAKHAGRNTVKKEDIALAIEIMKQFKITHIQKG